ncbi:MAG TPA: hypothetical protein VGM82_06335 [Gemmatimonadaceae bacterium]|jgi:hypothetical protein
MHPRLQRLKRCGPSANDRDDLAVEDERAPGAVRELTQRCRDLRKLLLFVATFRVTRRVDRDVAAATTRMPSYFCSNAQSPPSGTASATVAYIGSSVLIR